MMKKTVWLFKWEPSAGIDLAIRMERVESAAKATCVLELEQSGADRPGTNKRAFPISGEVVERLEEAVASLKEIPFPQRPPQDLPTIQHRYEDDKSGLVVMWEILPFSRRDEAKGQYKIGDGLGLDYVFGESSEMLDRLVHKLKRAVFAPF